MAEKLRVGAIGCGRWSKMAHIPGWVRSDLCELVAVCDRDRARAVEAAELFGIPEVIDDPEEMIRREDLDVIDVCTNLEGHEPLSALAIE
ncbi:MAG: Gfo/Idh/MocA family oxidoreductase [Atopobiaceae bacterium]|nr:Gfo/Idh/MocA family oxidoreductase [Atopobiaceae bacterium]